MVYWSLESPQIDTMIQKVLIWIIRTRNTLPCFLVPYEQLDIPTLTAYTAPGNASLDAYPHDAKPNILLYYQELRGTLVSFTIETDTQPKPTDFALTSRSLETPKYEIELVDKVLYNGQLLKRE